MIKRIITTVFVSLMIIVFTWSIFLPSIGMIRNDLLYAQDSDDDDILLLFLPAILSGAKKAEPSVLTVSSPNGGETLTAGSWYEITWISDSQSDAVDIELSSDSGGSYPLTIAKGIPSDGSYIWGPVPFHDPNKLGSTFKIRIRDSEDYSTVDITDGVFTIQEAASTVMTDQLDAMNDSLAADPYETDSDEDGFFDNVEIYLGTDPLKWDSDQDGIDDYYEVIGDVNRPIPDGDSDGIIAALDNDDDNDGQNDGRALDSDGDEIPDYLETYGFIYISTAPLRYYLWDGDISESYFKTNPYQNSTDQDQYSDSVEVTGTNMDLTVESPGDNPMVTAFPNFVVELIDYDITLNEQITETDGTVHSSGTNWSNTLEKSTSVTDEWHWEVGQEVSASLLDFGSSMNVSYGESHSETHTTGNAWSSGGDMSTANEWSTATCSNPSEAARIKLNFEIQNKGTCAAKNVRITMNLKIGGKLIMTITHPVAPDTINQILPGQKIEWESDFHDLTLDELRAVRTGSVLTAEISSISADVVKKDGAEYVVVDDWGSYFAAAENTGAHLFLDLGDGNTIEHIVYAGDDPWEPKVTLRDALIWAANGEETEEDGPHIRFYQPDGTLGGPEPLDGWYFSLDEDTYNNNINYMQNPGFNFFDTILTPTSVLVAKAPPIHPTPKIHWAILSPVDGEVTAYVDDYFFDNNRLTVYFVDKDGTEWPMTWDPIRLRYSCDCPNDYFKDDTEQIVAINPLYNNSNDPNSQNYRRVMTAAEITYVPSYKIVGSCSTTSGRAENVFIKDNHAYVTGYGAGLQIIDISDPENPDVVGVYDLPYPEPGDVFVQGDYAYVADFETLQIIDISDKTNPTFAGSFTTEPDRIFHARGVFVKDNIAFVADSFSHLYAIDISNPANPEYINECFMPQAEDVFVQGNYAYVANYYNGFNVVDISNPAAGMPVMGTYDTPHIAMAVHVSGNYAYVADIDTGLLVFNISNPSSPVLVGTYDTDDGEFWRVFVKDNIAYLSDRVYDHGLHILDVSDPANPTNDYTFNIPGQTWGSSRVGDYIYEVNGSSATWMGRDNFHVIAFK